MGMKRSRVGRLLGAILLASAASAASANDVVSGTIIKIANFNESGYASPVSAGYQFRGTLLLSPGGATSSVLWSGPFTGSSKSGSSLLSPTYSTLAALDSAYPDGHYAITMQTADDGPKSFSLNFSGDDYLPAPHVSDVLPLSATSLEIDWDPLAGATAQDQIGYYVYAGGAATFRGTVWATTTSITITSLPGVTNFLADTLSVNLSAIRIVDTDNSDYPGSTAQAEYVSSTQQGLITPNGSAPEPASLGLLALGSLLFLRRRAGSPPFRAR